MQLWINPACRPQSRCCRQAVLTLVQVFLRAYVTIDTPSRPQLAAVINLFVLPRLFVYLCCSHSRSLHCLKVNESDFSIKSFFIPLNLYVTDLKPCDYYIIFLKRRRVENMIYPFVELGQTLLCVLRRLDFSVLNLLVGYVRVF